MRTAIDSRGSSPRGGRFPGGVALAAFLGAFFVLPLWAALTLCTMPCCHHSGDTSSPVVTAAMTGCQTQCSIAAANEATPTAAVVVPAPAHENGIAPAAATVVVVDVTVVPSVLASSAALPMTHGVDAPIHVLNSTFRI